MGEGLEDFWPPSLQCQGARDPVLRGHLAWKWASPVVALSVSPFHLPFSPWLALKDGSSTFDPLAKPPVSTETKEGLECTQALPSGKPSSPVGKQEAGNDCNCAEKWAPSTGLSLLLPLTE